MMLKNTISLLRPYAIILSSICLILAVFILPFISPKFKIALDLLYIALGLQLLFYPAGFKRLYEIRLPIAILLGIIAMAYISLFFSVDISTTMTDIKYLLLQPSLFMLTGFLVFRSLQEYHKDYLKIFLYIIAFGVIIFPLLTIYDGIFYQPSFIGGRSMWSRYYAPATVWTFYLLIPLSIYLAGSILSSGKMRVLFIILLFITILASISNGTRFLFVGFICILFSLLFLLRFRHRFKIAIFSVLVFCTFVGGLYSISKDFSPRYNFHNMLNNYITLWSLPPAAMGRYDDMCAIDYPHFKCSSYSRPLDDSIRLDYSLTSRTSMLKSTLLAIMDNPLRPNGFSFWQFPNNIQNIFSVDSASHPFSLSIYDNKIIFQYPHNHNMISSVWFELGLMGFVLYGMFIIYFIFAQKRLFDTSDIVLYKVTSLSSILFIVGLIGCNLFDCFPIRDGMIILFIFFGMAFSLYRHNLPLADK